MFTVIIISPNLHYRTHMYPTTDLILPEKPSLTNSLPLIPSSSVPMAGPMRKRGWNSVKLLIENIYKKYSLLVCQSRIKIRIYIITLSPIERYRATIHAEINSVVRWFYVEVISYFALVYIVQQKRPKFDIHCLIF